MRAKLILHFYLLFLAYVFSFSQSIIGQVRSDSLLSKSQSELEALYTKHKNSSPLQAQLYSDALYEIAIQGKIQKNIAKALYKKAYVEFKLGKNKKALQFLEASEAIGKAINNDSLLLRNVNLKGNIYLYESDYTAAIDYYLEAKNIAERMGNTRDILAISRNVALIKKEINDLEGALDIFLNNLERIKQENSPELKRQELLSYFSLVDTYLRLENLEQATLHNNSGLNHSKDKAFLDLHTSFLSNKAIISYKLKNYQQTIDICKSIIDDPNNATYSKILITSYLYLGKSFFELNDYEKTILYFEKIRTLSHNYEDVSPFNLREIYYLLAKCHIEQGNAELSTKNFDLLMTLDKENDLVIKNAERKMFKTYDLAELKSQLDVLNLKLSKQKKIAYYLYGLALAIIVFLIIFFRRKQKTNKLKFEKLVLEIEKLEHIRQQPSLEKSGLVVTDHNVVEILNSLKTFEMDKLYLDSECNLSYVAKKINTNTSYLSNVINKHKGIPFKTYLSELRINEALIQLKNNKRLRTYTIKAIAAEFGFKRQETFSRAFKARTGIYPSTYIKKLEYNILT